ncbi:MAG TPA: threonine/serine dehydratase [Thermomicrobiales bacterium]|nr:threonine/serine dehydratase [Thermomicrobiales bacterium]HRA47503.1 threonine/serine dehydratase [Thermomicrobiales bacterium]
MTDKQTSTSAATVKIGDLPVTIRDVWAAKLRISSMIWRTSLLPTATLSRMTDTNLRIKTENLQRTCSFKFRGGLNAVLQLTPAQRERGVCTFSAGNHGQGLAYAAQLSGVHCTVFMARDANPQKIEAIRGYGADLIFGDSIGDASDRMEIFQQETGATYISPYGDPAVIAGQGTIGLELLEDFPELEYVVLGIGGGGLASGVALAIKSIRPEVKIIGVEPEGAPTLTRSLEEGRPVRLESIKTIADGLGAPYALPIPLEIIKTLLDDVVLVDDEMLADAMRLLLSRCKLLVEPAGAASVAALLNRKIDIPKGANTVAILSGGNIDMEKLKALL